MRVHLAIARALGRSLLDTYAYLGDELTLWEAEYGISPWGPERGDMNAWQVSSAATRPGCTPPNFREFDLTRGPKEPVMTQTEIASEVRKTAASFPGAKLTRK